MGRHALMYRNQRQHWLARKVASHQPLVARIARHQRLLHELKPTAGTSEWTGTRPLPERDFNRVGQRALPLAGHLFRPLLVGEAEEERVLSSVPSPVPDRSLAGQDEEYPDQEATFGLTAANAMDGTEIEPSSLLDQPEKVSDQQEARGESVNQLLELGGQEPASTDRSPESDRSPEALSAHRENTDQSSGINEPVEAKLQQEQKIVDERGQPIENAKTRRSRGRIQEQPAEAVHTPSTLAAPSSPPSKVARRNEQEAAGKEASVADDLFAPRDTDRSPQAWMARLMGAKSTLRNDVATPSATVETEPGGVQTGSVASDQPERRQQPTDNDQFIPPGAQGRFAPASEGPVTVTYQTDRSRKLKAGSQPLPAARANVARDSSEARPVPTPLSQRARRFLQPLVGIDPASVRIYRDARAEQLADAYRADAFTVGDDVAIAVGYPDDTPETLGLLAHEFTHVVRRREPRFLPPIARLGLPPSQERRALSMDETAAGMLSIQEDEEMLARRVERRVTQVAEEQVDQMESFPTGSASSFAEPSAGAGTTRVVSVPRPARDSWGGLPAPWEPLPDWLVSSSETTEGSGHAAVVAPQPPQIAHVVGGAESGLSGVSEAYGGGGTWNSSGPSDTRVQRAGLERSLGEEEQTMVSAQQSAPDTVTSPEPDLDALARQVYSLLKRRLGVEYRRES